VEDIEKFDYQAEGCSTCRAGALFHPAQTGRGGHLGRALNDAMSAIEAENDDLKGVLPRAYTRIENWVLVELLRLLAPVRIEGDAFGQVYDTSSATSPQEGQKGGVFYTPTSIVRLIVEIIEPSTAASSTPPCGSGGHVRAQRCLREEPPQTRVDELTVFGTRRTKPPSSWPR